MRAKSSGARSVSVTFAKSSRKSANVAKAYVRAGSARSTQTDAVLRGQRAKGLGANGSLEVAVELHLCEPAHVEAAVLGRIHP